MWVIYKRPADFRDSFVARRWEIYPWGPYPTDSVLRVEIPASPNDDQETVADLESDALFILRTYLHSRGLVCVGRNADDPDVVVETWI